MHAFSSLPAHAAEPKPTVAINSSTTKPILRPSILRVQTARSRFEVLVKRWRIKGLAVLRLLHNCKAKGHALMMNENNPCAPGFIPPSMRHPTLPSGQILVHIFMPMDTHPGFLYGQHGFSGARLLSYGTGGLAWG